VAVISRMLIHNYRSEGLPRVIAFASEIGAGWLPAASGPWCQADGHGAEGVAGLPDFIRNAVAERQDAEECRARASELKPRRQTVHFLGRDIPVLAADDGTLRAEDDGKLASARSVQSYIARAFGDRLAEARAAIEVLAGSLPPEELNRVVFRLYERFRPDVPERAQRWGAKGELRVERILGATG
jgi:hypothetical protein